MQNLFFAHRRIIVAASFAGLALLLIGPKSYGKILGSPSVAVHAQSMHKDPAISEPSWPFEREQSSTHSPEIVSKDAATPIRPGPDRLLSQIQREALPETATRFAAAEPEASSGWTFELALGAGLLAVLAMAAAMTVFFRHRHAVSISR